MPFYFKTQGQEVQRHQNALCASLLWHSFMQFGRVLALFLLVAFWPWANGSNSHQSFEQSGPLLCLLVLQYHNPIQYNPFSSWRCKHSMLYFSKLTLFLKKKKTFSSSVSQFKTDLQTWLIVKGKRATFKKVHAMPLCSYPICCILSQYKHVFLTILIVGGLFLLAISFSIMGLYASVVLVIGKFVREFFSGISHSIMFEELPNVDRILKLCTDIFLVRETGELELEEDLYAKLIFLYRSPETMIKWTREKTNWFLKSQTANGVIIWIFFLIKKKHNTLGRAKHFWSGSNRFSLAGGWKKLVFSVMESHPAQEGTLKFFVPPFLWNQGSLL